MSSYDIQEPPTAEDLAEFYDGDYSECCGVPIDDGRCIGCKRPVNQSLIEARAEDDAIDRAREEGRL